MMPEQLSCLADRADLDTSDFRRTPRRHRAALRRVKLEGWATDDRPIPSRNNKPAEQRKPDRRHVIGTGGGVVRQRLAAPLVPGNEPVSASRECSGAEQGAVVFANQKRPVTPVAKELGV